MSLNSLAYSRMSREVRGRRTVSASDDSTAEGEKQDVQNALSALVEYIPTETVTIYVAGLSALPALAETFPGFDASRLYWGLAILTPILYILIYAGKRRAAGEPRLPGLAAWPWWPMTAAFVAFLAWGLAVPTAPYLDSENGRMISGLIAIVVSILLGVLGRFFAPKT